MKKRIRNNLPALEELERIHESDRTKQQARWLERRRLQKMTGKEKIVHILTYHKAAAACLAILLISPFGIYRWLEHRKENIILSAAIVNSLKTDSEQLQNIIKSLEGSESKYDIITVYTDIYTDQEGIFDYNSLMFVNVHAAAAEIDLMIMDQSAYEFCRDREFLMDMETLLGDDFCRRYRAEMESDCIVAEASDLSDLMTLRYDTAYIGVMANAPNAATAADWIRYLLAQP